MVLGSLLSALLCTLNAGGFVATVAVYTQTVTNAGGMRAEAELPARVMRSVGDSWRGCWRSLSPSICHVAPFADSHGVL